jgi:AmiR/NasT family two-component response regulator
VRLAGRLAHAARVFCAQQSLGETMTQVAGLAIEIVPGVDAAGLSVFDRHARDSVVTDSFAGACEAVQFRLGRGPAVERALGDDVVVVDDLVKDARWPELTARLHRLGVRALVACHLSGERVAPARLNLYARQPLPPDAVEVAALYAVHASVAMVHASEVAQLKDAMTTREHIGQAIGVLMHQHQLAPERVFEVLVHVSQELNIKLRDVAKIVLESRIDPGDVADLTRRAAKDAGERVDALRWRRAGGSAAEKNRTDAERRARMAAARAVHRLCESAAHSQGRAGGGS